MRKISFLIATFLILTSIQANHVVTDAWKYVPELDIELTTDPVSGLNLELISENFIFDPANAGGENMIGHGHAHLYVNDKKVARVYSNWFHISNADLKVGMNRIRVSLNANNHEELYFKNSPIDQVLSIHYAGSKPGNGHDHGHHH